MTQFTMLILILTLITGLCGSDLVPNLLLSDGKDDGMVSLNAPISMDIGIVVPLTGRHATAYGISMERVFLLARDEINTSELSPVRINFMVEDNTSTAEGSAAAFKRLVEADVPVIAGTSERIFISQNDGRSWYAVPFKDLVTAITADGETVYLGTRTQGVFRSDDAGVTWKPIRDGLQTYDNGTYGEVRRILLMSDQIINVMYHKGTYVSNDRGETWLDVADIWEGRWTDSIHFMMEFGGYLWSAISNRSMWRSLDNGQTWESLRQYETSHVTDWAVLNNRLYIAGSDGIGRWNEETRDWEYPMQGLPTGSRYDPDAPPSVLSLAVHDGRLFAGLKGHGVYVFDARMDTWGSVGLDGLWGYALLSYKSSLYAGTNDGLYSAMIDRVQPHGKAVTTWGRIKRNAKD